MAKPESNLINMTLTLLVVSLVSSGALGFVYQTTKEPIAQAALAKMQKAIENVVPNFDNDPISSKQTIELPDGVIEVFPAKKGKEPLGNAVKSFTKKGFSGLITIMVGFNDKKEITNIEVLEHKETPGLGTKMADPSFKNQFVGLNPGSLSIKVKKDGGTIDAISGATISSRAFIDAVNRAYQELEKTEKK